MKKILIVLLTMVLLLAGCGKNGASSPQSPSDESVTDQQEPSSSETEISSEDHAIPGTYTVPEGWEKSEKHSTDSQIFYIEEGHENDEKPDNISIHVGKNKYSLDEHEQFRDAIVQQILMQLDGIEDVYKRQDQVIQAVQPKGGITLVQAQQPAFQFLILLPRCV